MEVGTYENDSLMFVALDESVAPSGNSYTLFDEWFAWQDIAVANDISDGEWGIRAVVSPGESFAVAYNVYRRSEGISFDEPLLAGTGVSEASFMDYDVMNGLDLIFTRSRPSSILVPLWWKAVFRMSGSHSADGRSLYLGIR